MLPTLSTFFCEILLNIASIEWLPAINFGPIVVRLRGVSLYARVLFRSLIFCIEFLCSTGYIVRDRLFKIECSLTKKHVT